MGLQIVLLLITSGAAAACLLTFVPPNKRGRSLAYYFAMGVGLLFLLSLPAGIYQGVFLVDDSKPLPARLAMAGIAAPYNMGGWTVRQVFEALTDPFPPNGKGVVIPVAVAKFPVFFIPLLFQSGAAAYLFARRIRARQDFTDPVILGLGLVVLLNSMANAYWAWWGK